MATNDTQSSDSTNQDNSETDESNTDQDQQDTGETSGQSTDQSKDDTDKASKQEDKRDPAKQALLADLHKERKSLKAATTELSALKTEVESLRPVKDTLDAVQTKYDRLEAFLQAAGGTLGKALDSRTFTKALFETDEDIKDIVKKWNVANPTATSTALGSTAAAPGKQKIDANALLRAAAGH